MKAGPGPRTSSRLSKYTRAPRASSMIIALRPPCTMPLLCRQVLSEPLSAQGLFGCTARLLCVHNILPSLGGMDTCFFTCC